MKPLFQVGEEVILQSKDMPKLNGEYIIEKILDIGEDTTCHITGKEYNTKLLNSMSYVLNGLHSLQSMSDGRIVDMELLWKESALRKRHKPSDDSFDSMMDKLKTLIKVSQKLSEKIS